jgi:glycosyltransferase involved in cell wall biosynthesis
VNVTPGEPDPAPVSASVTVVIPAYNAAHYLEQVLPAALLAAKGARVLVVDAGSTDETAAVAARLGAEVLRVGHRAGPAEARNRGVETVTTDVALFVDADCVPHADVVERVARAFGQRPELVTLIGSYDDRPPEQNFASQYMNLRHHFTHQHARREGAGFWAGCGAVRAAVFRAVGGFDSERFPRPMIEDIELGVRMSARGVMALDPSLHVTHLKRWTVGGVVTTDIFMRAVPWGRLILETGVAPNDLNLSYRARLAAVVAPFALLAIAAVPVFLAAGLTQAAIVAALPVGAALVLNFPLVAFFARRRGIVFALSGFAFHQVHLTYSAATMGLLVVERALSRRTRRHA